MKCPYCGAEIDVSAPFCPNCGARLANQTPQTAPAAQPQQPNPYAQQPGYAQQGGYAQPQAYQQQAYQQQAYQQQAYQQQAYQQQAYQQQAYQQQAYQQQAYQQQAYQQQAYQQQAYQQQAGTALQAKPPKAKKAGPKFDLKALFAKLPKFKMPKISLPKLSKKVMLIGGGIVAAVLVLVIALSVIAGGSSSGSYPPAKGNIQTLSVADEGLMILQDGKQVGDFMDVSLRGSNASLDGTVYIMRDTESVLHVVTKGEVREVAEDVYDYTISADGSMIACTDKEGTLYIYTVNKLEETEIAENVEEFTFSPDGKTLVYLVQEDREYIAYIYDGKKSTEIDDGIYPFAVSNGGKYIYCVNEDEDLYVYNAKGEKTKLGTEVEDDVLLNKDHTQIVFNSKGKWYVSVKGGEKIKLGSDSYMNMVLPMFCKAMVENTSVYTYDVDTLAGNFYFSRTDDTIIYVNKKWEVTKVAKDVDSYHLSTDGQTLMYLRDNGSVYMATAKKPGDAKEMAEDVEFFTMNPDGSAFYFADEDDTFWYQKGTKEPKRIAEDVYMSTMTVDGYCLIMCDYSNFSGTLYASKDGGKRQQVSSDAFIMNANATVTYLLTEYNSKGGEFVVQAATNGIKFKVIYE